MGNRPWLCLSSNSSVEWPIYGLNEYDVVASEDKPALRGGALWVEFIFEELYEIKEFEVDNDDDAFVDVEVNTDLVKDDNGGGDKGRRLKDPVPLRFGIFKVESRKNPTSPPNFKITP